MAIKSISIFHSLLVIMSRIWITGFKSSYETIPVNLFFLKNLSLLHQLIQGILASVVVGRVINFPVKPRYAYGFIGGIAPIYHHIKSAMPHCFAVSVMPGQLLGQTAPLRSQRYYFFYQWNIYQLALLPIYQTHTASMLFFKKKTETSSI